MNPAGPRILAAAHSLIGQPWGLHAAGPDAWGCVGLVLEAHRQAGIPLTNPYPPAGQRANRPGALLLHQCDRLPEGEAGDIVIFVWPHPRLLILHVGIVVRPGCMIASEPDRGVGRVEWRNDSVMVQRFAGYARVKQQRGNT